MALDLTISIGNVITVGTIIFTVGGAWTAITRGLKESQDKNQAQTARIDERLKDMTTSMEKMHTTFVSKELDAANERALLVKLQALEARVDAELAVRHRAPRR